MKKVYEDGVGVGAPTNSVAANGVGGITGEIGRAHV